MRNEGSLLLLLASLVSLSPLGCSRGPDPSQEAGAVAAPLPAQSFLYSDGTGSESRVSRVKDPTGAEILHGETTIRSKDFHAFVVEDAVLDPDGNLLRAEVSIADAPSAPPVRRALFDKARGTVRIEQNGAAAELTVPRDAPWAYQPLPDENWHAVSTPVSSWVALRASAAPWVRWIRAGERRSDRVPSDQIAFLTEAGKTVVLGCDGADVSAGFIDRVTLTGLGVTLTRVDFRQSSALDVERRAHGRLP